MKIKIILLPLVFITLLSCSSEVPADPVLTGTYIETSPQPGRTKLTFLSGNRVRKTESGSPTGDTFLYEISGNNIKLIPPADPSLSASFKFEIVSANRFRIGNLRPSIPENPPVIMTFEK